MLTGDSRFDGIVIGGGHNGLITAAYLSACGLRVAVCESDPDVGGGLRTFHAASGAFHDLHAVHLKLHLGPILEDLQLDDYGVRLITPEVKIAAVGDKMRALLVHRDLAATCESLARLSPRDAAVFRREAPRWRSWTQRFLIPEIYNPPETIDVRTSRLRHQPDADDYLGLSSVTPRDYVNSLFHESLVRDTVLWAFMAQGYMSDYQGISPLAMFTAFSALTEPMAICAGGSSQIAAALKRFV